MTWHYVINAPCNGRQINDHQIKSLICEERENDAFRFPHENNVSQKANGLFATLSIILQGFIHTSRPEPFQVEGDITIPQPLEGRNYLLQGPAC